MGYDGPAGKGRTYLENGKRKRSGTLPGGASYQAERKKSGERSAGAGKVSPEGVRRSFIREKPPGKPQARLTTRSRVETAGKTGYLASRGTEGSIKKTRVMAGNKFRNTVTTPKEKVIKKGTSKVIWSKSAPHRIVKNDVKVTSEKVIKRGKK